MAVNKDRLAAEMAKQFVHNRSASIYENVSAAIDAYIAIDSREIPSFGREKQPHSREIFA